MQNKKLTPLMRQYWQIKSLHKDKILLFRMGDFFEMFHNDAEKAAPVLNITLTARNKKAADETKMCGVPHHSVAGPIGKLLAAGFKVAVCDQVEPAHQSKGLVKREVTRILTPGMVYDPSNLDQLTANYLCAFDKNSVSFLDMSTGEAFFYLSSNEREQKQLIYLLNPVELVLTSQQKELFFTQEEWKNFHLSVFDTGKEHHSDLSESSHGDRPDPFDSILPEDAPSSAILLLKYVKTQQGVRALEVIQKFQKRVLGNEMQFSSQVPDHLELFKTYNRGKKGSLFTAINRTKTPAGARLLKSRINFPSIDRKALERRLDYVENWFTNTEQMSVVRNHLSEVGDMERRLGKVAHPQCRERDLLAVSGSLRAGLKIIPFWADAPVSLLVLKSAKQLADEIDRTVQADSQRDSNTTIIQKGVSEELDQLTDEANRQQSRLRKLEERERKNTGIYSLKIRYNNVFGYYIEVTKAHLKKVPPYYIRKQTLTQAERYTTDKLQSIEETVLSLRMRVSKLEEAIFESLRQKVIGYFPDLFSLSRVLCELDVHVSLAYLALERNYIRPQFSDKKQLVLVNSRHPVVEQHHHRSFVPNTIRMKSGECLLLTGPNMAGKSTLMRQVALSVILAQAGSFVPAEQAILPLFNKLFTRIGASDSLSEGLSTFMVEMKESAEILKTADEDSLIILDEIGRGTATYDGMSIAQGILEYLVLRKKSLIFFATHYHELTQLGKTFTSIRNAHLSVREKEGVIDFLYVMVSGAALQSYGVHVAQLAGFPTEVIQRASELLQQRESGSIVKKKTSGLPNPESFIIKNPDPSLYSLFQEIRSYPLQEKSPLETVNTVAEWKREITEKS